MRSANGNKLTLFIALKGLNLGVAPVDFYEFYSAIKCVWCQIQDQWQHREFLERDASIRISSSRSSVLFFCLRKRKQSQGLNFLTFKPFSLFLVFVAIFIKFSFPFYPICRIIFCDAWGGWVSISLPFSVSGSKNVLTIFFLPNAEGENCIRECQTDPVFLFETFRSLLLPWFIFLLL